MKIATLLIPAMMCSWSVVRACASSGTPESIAIQNIKMGMRTFEKLHGYSPSNWFQIDEAIDLNEINRTLGSSPVNPFQEHYVFVRQEVPMLSETEGNLALIRTEPLTNAAGIEGRYMISKTTEGFQYNWYSEDKVQRMLVKAGIPELPKPEAFIPSNRSALSAQHLNSGQRLENSASLVGSNSPPNTAPGTASVSDENIIPKPLPTIEPNTNSVSPESAATPSLKWLLVGVLVVLGGGFVYLLFRNKSR